MSIYKNVSSREKVTEEEALDYVLDKIKNDEKTYSNFVNDFGVDLVEWFFSGNWILQEVEEEPYDNEPDGMDLAKEMRLKEEGLI